MKSLLSKAEKRRQRERNRIKLYCAAGSVLMILILVMFGLLHMPFLKIDTIEISGIVTMEEVRPLVLANPEARFLGINNFFSWPSEVNGVKVKKDYAKNILTLIGPDAERFAIWCTASELVGNCFWVNRYGLAIGAAPDTEGSTIAKINDGRRFVPVAGKSVLDGQFESVAGLVEGLGDLPITIQSYVYDNDLQELVVTPAKGGKMIFSTRFVPSTKLFASLNNLIVNGQIRTAQYADFTVE